RYSIQELKRSVEPLHSKRIQTSKAVSSHRTPNESKAVSSHRTPQSRCIMARRYLFGPVTPRFIDQNLYRACQAGECLAFQPGEDVEQLVKTVDFVVLDLHYTSIPAYLWQAPVPLVGLAQDWNLLWHGYRHFLKHVDLVLTDTAGVERLACEG